MAKKIDLIAEANKLLSQNGYTVTGARKDEMTSRGQARFERKAILNTPMGNNIR